MRRQLQLDVVSSLGMSTTSKAVSMILSDIPLLCEGIMGIGIFTFLFIVKQVGWLACFLYASSFFTFVAATLDLSRTIALDRLITEDAIRGLSSARDVFLGFSDLSLNIYLWTLVSQCPRHENEDIGKTTKSWRQSWDRWGIPGRILKWASLTAALTAPILQIIWKLVPSQHEYSPVYVADSVIETTLACAFILIFILNAYICPSSSWWQSFRSDITAVSALVIGVMLGIGNLRFFSLTENSLGRLLGAVEVYLLFIHNLCMIFRDVLNSARVSARQAYELPLKGETEKEPMQLVTRVPYNLGGTVDTQPHQRVVEVDQRCGGPPGPAISYMWTSQTKTPTALLKQRNRFQPRTSALLGSPMGISPPLAKNQLNSRSGTTTHLLKGEKPLPIPISVLPQLQGPAIPVTPLSAGRNLDRRSLQVTAEVFAPSPNPFVVTEDILEQDKQESPRAQSRQSMSSLDEIIRQQNELDQNIAALQAELSVATSPLYSESPEFLRILANPVRSTLRSSVLTTPTEGTSNNSVFSLSIFPEPPAGTRNDSLDLDNIVDRNRSWKKKKRFNDAQISTSNTMISPVTSILGNRFDSTGTQWDVTSFIGNLTLSQPPGTPRAMSPDSIIGNTPTNSTIIRPYNAALRPLILVSDHHSSLVQPMRIDAQLARGSPLRPQSAGSEPRVLPISPGSSPTETTLPTDNYHSAMTSDR